MRAIDFPIRTAQRVAPAPRLPIGKLLRRGFQHRPERFSCTVPEEITSKANASVNRLLISVV